MGADGHRHRQGEPQRQNLTAPEHAPYSGGQEYIRHTDRADQTRGRHEGGTQRAKSLVAADRALSGISAGWESTPAP